MADANDLSKWDIISCYVPVPETKWAVFTAAYKHRSKSKKDKDLIGLWGDYSHPDLDLLTYVEHLCWTPADSDGIVHVHLIIFEEKCKERPEVLVNQSGFLLRSYFVDLGLFLSFNIEGMTWEVRRPQIAEATSLSATL